MDLYIFLSSIVYAAFGLIVFTSGLIVAAVPSQRLVIRTQRANPRNSYWFSGLLGWLLVIWLILTIIGCVWLVFTLFKGQLDTLLELATLTSVAQGFVYGSAGVVIGWRGLQQ